MGQETCEEDGDIPELISTRTQENAMKLSCIAGKFTGKIDRIKDL
jgi:hypothetical protein